MPTPANSINESTTGVCGFTGTGFTSTAVTAHDVLIGGATSSTLSQAAPSSTSGVPLISQGASSDPVFGTAVVAGGGTGQVTLTNHGVLVGAGTSAITQLAAGSSGQILQSGGASADPTYSTATYPATATSTGTILRADGTNWSATTATYPNTTTASNILYSNGANTIAGLATANGGVLVTSNTGVPSILAGSGTSGQVLQAVSGAAPAWSTPTYPSASGSTGVILRSDGTNYVATTSTYPNTNAINTLLYASAANVMSALATANNGTLITSSGGVPSISSTLPTAVQGNITSLGNIGNQTNTTRACFFARLGSNITNATGDGTVFTPIIFDTNVFDQNSNYGTGTGLFTAPATGKYFFKVQVTCTGLLSTHTRGLLIFKVNSSASSYLINVCNIGAIRDGTNSQAVLQGSGIFNLTSGNTFFVQLEVDNGTKVVGILGDNESSYFTGYMMC